MMKEEEATYGGADIPPEERVGIGVHGAPDCGDEGQHTVVDVLAPAGVLDQSAHEPVLHGHSV